MEFGDLYEEGGNRWRVVGAEDMRTGTFYVLSVQRNDGYWKHLRPSDVPEGLKGSAFRHYEEVDWTYYLENLKLGE